ncbi:hypothetical protein VOLCADRAFT_107762 [Volvox carteri f. nagariensis]|uniref:YbaK/aminoacyl-tRNA synthetase-associated domain-containing protein n=1 Tax=Volvox carteri f. nagariensis TaxID=3068 RepID=D8UG78_VOLCA|nr:uncharacterized protein VOLCADRAFT_107762 [Volvox carteri f. nagariensis]EFJ41241.1 hypothetical protein VOLCADRAFT_107762 [Volvox carteri f. nagariensis]|eukprot:XP_002957692.1 hypothetical protein VOLCADRAFT_107762 [Volvox carteri f. nagariensis]
MADAESLKARYDAISSRLCSLEQHPAVRTALAVHKLGELQLGILQRIDKLAHALGLDLSVLTRPRLTVTPDASPTQQQLEQELIDRNFSSFSFVRVPADYYDQPLEFRQSCLGAASINHLCKSIVMENTRAHESVKGWEDPRNSKYYCVIVQYTARLHADKLKVGVQELGGRKFGRQYYNMRLAAEEVNDQLTGFSHNAVTPICMRERLPILMSHHIAKLQPREFWLGAGEVDLKLHRIEAAGTKHCLTGSAAALSILAHGSARKTLRKFYADTVIVNAGVTRLYQLDRTIPILAQDEL